MKGGRWWIWTVIPGGGAGNLLASLAPGWERYTASRVGQALAKHLNLPIVVIEARTRREAENALDIAPVQGEATFANPTLVHHGMINAASHHLLEDPGGSAVPLPLADLYSFRQKDAERVAQALSSGLRKRVMLLDNSGLPGALHHHPALDVGPLARRQRRLGNPAGLPVRGEVWTTVLGGRFKVLDATPTTVQGLHLDSGNREWIERGEFLATYKPPRQRNPRRAHAVTVAQAARELNAHHLRYSAGFYGMGSRWFGARVRAGQLQVWDFDNWTNAPAGTGFHDHNGQPLLVVPGAEPEGNPSRSLRAKISRSYGRLERSRKQRRAKARVRSGKASFAQFEHEIERHDVRRILQTGSSQARAYRSAQPPGYGERGRGRVWNPRADRPGNDRDFAAKTIRDALKRRSGHAWSVTVGRGTAWGWIGVTLPPSRRTWRHRLKPDMPDWPENYEGYDSGQPGGGMSPDQRAELAGLLGLEVNEVHGDGISIPGGFDYYDEYMDRAQGRTPERLGKPYWDNPRERPPVTGEIARIMAEVDRDRARDLRRTAARKGIKPKSLWLEMTGLHPIPKPNARGGPRIVFNRLLGGWYVVVGPHQTPLNGRFNSKAEAQAWLEGGPARRTPNPKGRAVIDSEWKARREARRKWGRGAQVWSGGVVGNKTFVVGVLTHAGSAFQAIGSGDSWEAAFTDAKGKRRPKPNPKGRNNPTRDQIFSVSGGSVTLAAAVKEFASSYWTKPRRTRFLTFSPDGMSATFQMVGGAGGIYRASFAPGGIIVERPPFTNPKGCKAATRKKWSERYEDMVSEAADLWASKANRLAMSGIGSPLYLYFRPSSGTSDGAFYWVGESESPDPIWQLASPEGIRPGFITQAQVRAKVWALGRRLPIIAPEGNPRGRNAETFEAWMRLVDAAVETKAGCSVHDLIDAPFADWYESGVSPKSAASRAIRSQRENPREPYDRETAERGVFGMTLVEVESYLAPQVKLDPAGWIGLAAAMLSDSQHLIANQEPDAARQLINRVKWVLFNKVPRGNPRRGELSRQSDKMACAACSRVRHNPGCPCDPACCGARGKVCECRCRGANHQRSSGHAEFGTPNPRRRFAVRRVDDLVHSATGDYTQGVWEVVDSTTGKAVFRSYNQRDARTESAYRNKFGSNPRSPFQVGEGVTVPYTGAASYFGRKVTRTRERATIHGVNDDGTVLVLVKRGQGTEQHIFPAAQVRRLPRRGVKATGARVGRVKARLELKGLRARQRGAGAEVERLTNEAECLEARAKLMDPEAPERRNLTARLSRTLTELDAERMIAGELERADPDYRDAHDLTGEDRAATAAWMGGRTSNPKGRKNPAGEAWAVFGGKYVLEEQAPQTYKNLGHVRLFIATGKRGATYGATLYEDGRFVWMNLAMRNNNVPFDLAQVSPARLIEGATRTNPRSSEVAKARAMFERWNSDAAPRAPRTSRVRVPAQPRALARLGELVAVTYRSDKFAGTPDNPDGRQQLYEHETKRPRPVLASDGDGHLHIVGGRMRPTADGLIN